MKVIDCREGWDSIQLEKTKQGLPIVRCVLPGDEGMTIFQRDLAIPAWQRQASPKEDCVLVTSSFDFGISGVGDTFVKMASAGREGSLPDFKYKVGTHNHVSGLLLEIPHEIKMWYSTHANIKDGRSVCLPLGMNPELLKHKEDIEPDKYLYLNFTEDNGRDEVAEKFKDCDFSTTRTFAHDAPKLPLKQYIRELQEHKFCLCPQGNGPDSYRFWECLYLGIIPVAKKCPLVDQFSELPILAIDNWNELLSKDFLNDSYDRIKSTEWDLKMLDRDYWIDRIRDTVI